MNSLKWVTPAFQPVTRFWWVTLTRGVLWATFGLYALSRSDLATFLIASLFGGLAILDGAANIANALEIRDPVLSSAWLLCGLASTGLGLIVVTLSPTQALEAVFCVSIWALATGLGAIAMYWRLSVGVAARRFVGLVGALSLCFAASLLLHPDTATASMVVFVGIYGLALGGVLILTALEGRRRAGPSR
ncbi:MAG TPA: DUF308 domain-containing protein [Steroidobacteraceae bacterium]